MLAMHRTLLKRTLALGLMGSLTLAFSGWSAEAFATGVFRFGKALQSLQAQNEAEPKPEEGSEEEPEEEAVKQTPFIKALYEAELRIRDNSELSKAVENAKPEERQAAQDKYTQNLAEAEAGLKKALALVGEADPPKYVNYARYLLTFVYVLQERNFEAAVLGEYLATHIPKEDSMSLEAAVFAKRAYMQEYFTAQQAGRNVDFERASLVDISKLMIELWPEAASAADARLTLARLAHQQGNLLVSADYYTSIPETAFQFIDSQLQAGQIYWTLFTDPTKLPQDYPQEQIPDLMTKSEMHLRTGIERAQSIDPLPPTPPESVIYGKITLAQIQIYKDQIEQGIELLTKEPYSVLKAIEVQDQTKRPEDGIQSKKVASLVYQILLRSYVGQGKIDEARTTMKTLEEIAGKDDTGFLTGIYLDLGKKLKRELESLKEANQTERYEQVSKSFQTLLEDIVNRNEGQTISGLIWVATTYDSFGEAEQGESSGQYFQKASETYQKILEMAQKDPVLSQNPGQLLGIRMALIQSKKKAGDFDEALQQLAEILQSNAKIIDAQIEAASVLQTQATQDPSNGGQRYLDAILGVKIGSNPQAEAWGWGKIALQLQRLIERQRNVELSTSLLGWREIALGRPEERQQQASSSKKSSLLASFEEKHLNAWYQNATCRYQYALLQSGKKQTEELTQAHTELSLLNTVVGDIPRDWAEKYNKLYNEIRGKLNLPQEQLFKAAEQTPETLAGS